MGGAGGRGRTSEDGTHGGGARGGGDGGGVAMETTVVAGESVAVAMGDDDCGRGRWRQWPWAAESGHDVCKKMA